MSAKRDMYVHLVPHPLLGEENWYTDPIFKYVLGSVPKVDLLVKEDVPEPSFDYRTSLEKSRRLKEYFLRFKSDKPLLGNLDRLNLAEDIKFYVRYFVNSGAKDLVIESELYNETDYEKIRKEARVIIEDLDIFHNHIKSGHLYEARESFFRQFDLLKQTAKLRDSLLPDLIEDYMKSKGVKRALLSFGNRHRDLAKHFDKDGRNTLFVITNDYFNCLSQQSEDDEFYERAFLISLIGPLINSSAIDAEHSAMDMVRSFRISELQEIEKELDERLNLASQYNQIMPFELCWHIDEIFTQELNKKDLAKLKPKWKYF